MYDAFLCVSYSHINLEPLRILLKEKNPCKRYTWTYISSGTDLVTIQTFPASIISTIQYEWMQVIWGHQCNFTLLSPKKQKPKHYALFSSLFLCTSDTQIYFCKCYVVHGELISVPLCSWRWFSLSKANLGEFSRLINRCHFWSLSSPWSLITDCEGQSHECSHSNTLMRTTAQSSDKLFWSINYS